MTNTARFIPSFCQDKLSKLKLTGKSKDQRHLMMEKEEEEEEEEEEKEGKEEEEEEEGE